MLRLHLVTDQLIQAEGLHLQRGVHNSLTTITAPGEILSKVNTAALPGVQRIAPALGIIVIIVLPMTPITGARIRSAVLPGVIHLIVEEQRGAVPLPVQVQMAEHEGTIN